MGVTDEAQGSRPVASNAGGDLGGERDVARRPWIAGGRVPKLLPATTSRPIAGQPLDVQ